MPAPLRFISSVTCRTLDSLRREGSPNGNCSKSLNNSYSAYSRFMVDKMGFSPGEAPKGAKPGKDNMLDFGDRPLFRFWLEPKKSSIINPNNRSP